MDYALTFIAMCLNNMLNLFTRLWNAIPGAVAFWTACFFIFIVGRFLLLPISGGIISGIHSDTAKSDQDLKRKGKKGK